MPSERLRDLWSWKELAAAAPDRAKGLGVRKVLQGAIKSVDEQARTVEVTISTATQDRDGDTIAVAGWVLDNYVANPVVQWAHQAATPAIGRSLRTWTAADGLHSICEFADPAIHPLAGTIFGLVARGFLRATSVGFAPLRWVQRADGGYDFLEQELLEYSWCNVPSNPEALVRAKSAGIDLAPLRSWADEVIRATPGARGDSPATWRELEGFLEASQTRSIWSRLVEALERSDPDTISVGGHRISLTETLKEVLPDLVAEALMAHTGRLPD